MAEISIGAGIQPIKATKKPVTRCRTGISDQWGLDGPVHY